MREILGRQILNRLEEEIRAINVTLIGPNIPRADVKFVLKNPSIIDTVGGLLSLSKTDLEALASETPKLKCWYRPTFSVYRLRRLTEHNKWSYQDTSFDCCGAFEFYYWKFFNRILLDYYHLAPFILGISSEVNYLFTILRDNGASVAAIVNNSYSGSFYLCLPDIPNARILKNYPNFYKFMYGAKLLLDNPYGE